MQKLRKNLILHCFTFFRFSSTFWWLRWKMLCTTLPCCSVARWCRSWGTFTIIFCPAWVIWQDSKSPSFALSGTGTRRTKKPFGWWVSCGGASGPWCQPSSGSVGGGSRLRETFAMNLRVMIDEISIKFCSDWDVQNGVMKWIKFVRVWLSEFQIKIQMSVLWECSVC